MLDRLMSWAGWRVAASATRRWQHHRRTDRITELASELGREIAEGRGRVMDQRAVVALETLARIIDLSLH